MTTTRKGTPRTAKSRSGKAEDVHGIVQGLRRIVKALELYSRAVHGRFGLTGPQLWAIKTLGRDGPLPVSHLADALAVHQASASILVSRLVARGLVQRVRSTQDRRVVLLSLTPAGRQVAAQAPEAAQGRLLHGLLAMSAQEVRAIRASVDRLVAAMEAEDVAATFFFADDD
ncbi:MAG TPA: MarR family transcriptional regulator [Gemmatimonadales bacterium]|nr:MarR family transcriptional regulator [Gemmatimonadales bacterium]